MDQEQTPHAPVHLPVAPTGMAAEAAKHEEAAPAESKPTESSPMDSRGATDPRALEAKVIEVLKTVYDPEIPVNIYELGLIYGIDVSPDAKVKVKMTLTAPACPVAETLPVEVERKILCIAEVNEAKVEIVWEPPWTKEMMSEEAKLELGIF